MNVNKDSLINKEIILDSEVTLINIIGDSALYKADIKDSSLYRNAIFDSLIDLEVDNNG